MSNTTASTAIFELKHSVETHTKLFAGPTPQLAVFLLKVIDFIEDEDVERRDSEIMSLAFSIVEATAIHIQKHIDSKKEEATKKGEEFPELVSQKGADILIALGKARHLQDKIEAKNMVLSAMAESVRALSTYTKATYVEITDSNRKKL